jgi:hypothetical protein
MRRIACLVLVLWCAFGQASRDDYRTAYREWREADPALERDASSGREDLAARAAKVASGAAKFGSARAAFLQQTSADQQQKLAWLETPPDAPSALTPDGAGTLIAAESRAVRRTMDTFAGDSDRGIRQVQGILARENTAVDALALAVDKRKRAADAVKAANSAAAESQLKAADEYQGLLADFKQSAEDSDKVMAAWARYYTELATAARAVSPAPTPVYAPSPPITPLPLVRYTGAWSFPPTGGMYHGAQPEVVDMVVHAEGGHAEGTLVARFKLPPGSSGDPVLKFDFSGEFKNTRTQVFTLTTSEGANGTIELIPGSAFNLLEVNFQTDPKPGKVRQGNLVLLKK